MDYLQNAFFDLPVLVSFLGGLLTFFTPCILPLIPSYMSYISGVGIGQMKYHSKAKMLQSSFLFVLGFSSIFFLLFLATFNIIGNFFSNHYVKWVSGFIVIVFGLHFLGVLKIAIFNKIKKLDTTRLEGNRFLKVIAPFLIGVGFAAGWTPCTGPIVSSMALLASTNQNLALMSSISFIVGLSIPFLLLSVFLTQGLAFIGRLKKQMRIIEIFCGIFLILVGLAIMFNMF